MNAEADSIPLHADLVEPLRQHISGKAAGDRVFSAIPEVRTLQRDLDKAGIPFVDELGRRLDIHAHRHTFDTLVVLGGAVLGEAQQLMRHSDPRLTMNVYAHVGLIPAASALAKVQLPPVAGVDDKTQAGWTKVGKGSDSLGFPASSVVDSNKVKIGIAIEGKTANFPNKFQCIVVSSQGSTTLDLLLQNTVDTVEKSGPRSSVG